MNDRSDPWASFDSWSGRDLWRQAWYFSSGEDTLFASLYARHRPRVPAGFVICPSWGSEFDHLLNLYHDLARGLSETFAAAVVYHPPGHGDSTGDPSSISFEDLVEACLDAQGSMAGRLPDLSWNLVGVRLGAAVAAVAAGRSRPDVAVFVQPAFDLPAYFAQLEQAGRRGRPDGAGDGDTLFGYPRPQESPDGRSDVIEALGRLAGTGIAVRASWPRLAQHGAASTPETIAPDMPTVSASDRWRPRPSTGDSRRLVKVTVAAAMTILRSRSAGRAPR